MRIVVYRLAMMTCFQTESDGGSMPLKICSDNLPPVAYSSILDALEAVMRQVGYHYFAEVRSKRIDPFYKELCFIIADVLVLDPVNVIPINGTKMPASLVQEVYGQLNRDHLNLVYENFRNTTHHVYNKKAYLRTALYNVVFELHAHIANDSF